MEILWAAFGISIIVAFVFYVLAEHWTRLLRKHSMVIRQLSERLRLVETLDDPLFRERVKESAPLPLDRVLTFSFGFSDHFWRETLGLCELDWEFVQSFGSFVGSVKLECWRSHTVVTITEILPTRQAAAWQTRSLHYYPLHQNHSVTLWELPISRPQVYGPTRSLGLVLYGDYLELCACGPQIESAEIRNSDSTEREGILFRAPLDSVPLAEFRTPNPIDAPLGNGNGAEHGANSAAWEAFYSWQDNHRGLEWRLHLRDLTRKSEWDRWKILESTAVPLVRNGL